jgi:RimJ/RimL family protein N-acetyltransferase
MRRQDKERRGEVMGEQPVVLTDGVVTLRAWEPEDAPAVFAACQNPIISRFIPVPLPYTEEVARQFVVRRRSDWYSDDERSFAITDAATGEVLGSIARHGPCGHRAQFGYWLAPSARGRGVATRALRLITDWTLETTDIIRLDLYTHPANDASGRVAERAGYVREGVRRAWDLDRDGNAFDAVFYVLVRGDRQPA